MKTKKAIVAAAVLILIAAVLGVAGMSLLNWDFKKLDTSEYIEKNYALPEDAGRVTSVRLDTSFPVRVTSGENLALKYYDTDSAMTDLTLSGGALTLSEKRGYEWWKFFRFTDKTVELTLPAGTALFVDATNIKLSAEGKALGDVTVNSTNLEIDLKDCTGGDFTIDGTNLKLTMQNCAFNRLEASGTNIEARFDGSAFSAIEFDATGLKLSAEPLSVPVLEIDATGVTAAVTLTSPKSDYTIKSDTTSGNPPASQTGSDPAKSIRIDCTSWSGSFGFSG